MNGIMYLKTEGEEQILPPTGLGYSLNLSGNSASRPKVMVRPKASPQTFAGSYREERTAVISYSV